MNEILKDLCARLPYNVMVEDRNGTHVLSAGNTEFVDLFNNKSNIKAYLRPMASMTDEEREHFQQCCDIITDENYGDGWSPSAWEEMRDFTDYCNERHLDYRGLIWKGLAIEAPKGMYKF